MADTQHSISAITVTAKNTVVHINMATAILVRASISRLVVNAFQLEITLYLSVKSTHKCAVLHRVGTSY